MDNFHQNTAAFMQWFKSQDGAFVHPDIQITDLRDKGKGRAVVATTDIPVGVDLFVIPRQIIINSETSDVSKREPKLLPYIQKPDKIDSDDDFEISEVPEPWLELLLVMLYEFVKGDLSLWKPYFDILPKSLDCLPYWSSNERTELQASTIGDGTKRFEIMKLIKTHVVPVVKTFPNLFTNGKYNIEELIELAFRMLNIISAYAFELEKEDDEQSDDENDGWMIDEQLKMGMVPMADMLNADAEFNAHMNHEDEKLTMTSLRLISTGEEVLNYYGPLSNGELVKRYGYTSNNHSRHDSVELRWSSIRKTINQMFGATELEDEDAEEIFCIERESGEPDETGSYASDAIFAGFSKDLEVAVMKVISKVLNAENNERKRIKSKQKHLKSGFYEVMEKVLTEKLVEYSTDLEIDEILLENTTTRGRLRMAIVVRLGEKRLLLEALNWSIEHREKITLQEPPSKKRKS